MYFPFYIHQFILFFLDFLYTVCNWICLAFVFYKILLLLNFPEKNLQNKDAVAAVNL